MIDTFLAAIRLDVLAALRAPGKWFQRLMRRRRERKTYEADMLVLTRQGDMDSFKCPKLGQIDKVRLWIFLKLRNLRKG